MTRKVVVGGMMAVWITALIVGVIAYLLVAHSARRYEDRLLVNLAGHPHQLVAGNATYTDIGQLSARGGLVLRRTAALSSFGRLPALHPGFVSLKVDGRQLRVFTRALRNGRVLSVAVSDAAAEASLSRLRQGVLIAMIGGALLVSALLIWITRRALAPLRDTATIADRIVATGDLSARIPAPRGDDEIARLSQALNRLLTHVEASQTVLRRLIADASHELRSPVTTLSGNLELLAGGRLGPADSAEALADARAEARRLATLVEDLLKLARADTIAVQERVAVLPMLEQATAGTPATLIATDPALAGVIVRGDAVSLRTLVRNLVDNALRYGGGACEVRLTAEEHWLRIEVIDHGPGVDPAERATIFGRFRRGAEARSQPGSGLGLAIVAATAQAHGGDVSIEDTSDGGATFVVRLPRE